MHPMASQQQQAPPAEDRAARHDQAPAEGQLSIEQMTRIMDVAATLRRERSIAERELNLSETKRMLRQRLLETAKVSGDPVSEAEIDAAIDHYFETQHEFEGPGASLETLMAHLYVMRNKIAMGVAVVGGGLALWWGLFGFGAMPTHRGGWLRHGLLSLGRSRW